MGWKGIPCWYNGIGAPVTSLQIARNEGGGPASGPTGGFHWGPSVSWNTYLDCWVMLMGKVTGPLGREAVFIFHSIKTETWEPQIIPSNGQSRSCYSTNPGIFSGILPCSP